MCLNRFGGKKWRDTLDKQDVDKVAQIAQLSMLFMQGVDICETSIAEGLYGQGAALLRQQMEIIAAMNEVWDGKRVPNKTPNISSLPEDLRPHYGGLSELTHAAVPEYLDHLFTDIKGDKVGASITPLYRKDLAIFLYRISLTLLMCFMEAQEKALQVAYGESYDEKEKKLIHLAVTANLLGAKELGEMPSDK